MLAVSSTRVREYKKYLTLHDVQSENTQRGPTTENNINKWKKLLNKIKCLYKMLVARHCGHKIFAEVETGDRFKQLVKI